MSKRRVIDRPDRGRGWSNGRYTKARTRNTTFEGEYYYAHCPECDRATGHEWDECVPCKQRIDAGNMKKPVVPKKQK